MRIEYCLICNQPIDTYSAKKLEKIIKYCLPATDRLWSAMILGIILDCDYKDVDEKLKELE